MDSEKMIFIVEHKSAEYSKFSSEYKRFINLESDEEQENYIVSLLTCIDNLCVFDCDEYATLDDALKKASAPYFTIRSGGAGNYLYIEFDEISVNYIGDEYIDFLGIYGVDTDDEIKKGVC